MRDQVRRAPWMDRTLLMTLVCFGGLAAPVAGAVRYVHPSGTDAGSCSSPAQACANIQRAVNVSTSGDEIRVAQGTYTFQPTLSSCTPQVAEAVVCFAGKSLTVRGGYATSDWTTSKPDRRPTVIDGQNLHRGLAVRLGTLVLEGFTVTRGLAQGLSCCNDGETFGFGGGLFGDESDVELRRVVFSNNRVRGGNTTGGGAEEWGGSAAGGGVALRAVPPGGALQRSAILVDVSFVGNTAEGGPGLERGGFALGGAMWSNHTALVASGIELIGNRVFGGSSSGDGQASDTSLADGLGGGIAVGGGDYFLEAVLATDNEAVGGSATTFAGGGFGGALFAETGSLTVRDSRLFGNRTLGADATNGGIAAGGAIMTQEANLLVERVVAYGNQCTGGDGNGGNQGSAGGGAVYVSRLGGTPTTTTMLNSVFAGNVLTAGNGAIIGGGGGGLFLQGVNATLDHLTLAANVPVSLGLMGQAIVTLNGSAVDLSHSVVADHTTPAVASLATLPGTTINLDRVMFANNSNDTNEGESISGGFTGQGTTQVVGDIRFRSPGAPDFDYHLTESSPARSQASGSSQPVDLDGEARSNPDLGADEQSARIFADSFESGSTTRWG